MLKDDILKLIPKGGPRYMSNKLLTDNKVYHQLMFETKFLPESANIVERIYCIVNDIKKAPVCLCCGGELKKLHKFEDEKHVYLYRFCSSKCTRSYVVDMTTEHIDDNFSDIVDIVKNKPLLIVKNRPDYVNKIKCHLNSIGVDYKQMTYPEAYHFINNGMKELPKCLNCGGKVNYNVNSKGEYHKFCSNDCNMKSDLTKKKREETNLKVYGVGNVFQDESIKKTINEVRWGKK